MSTITEYLEELSGRSVTVIGMGISNVPLIKMLLRAGVKVTVRDKANREKVADLAQELGEPGSHAGAWPGLSEGPGRGAYLPHPGPQPQHPGAGPGRGERSRPELGDGGLLPALPLQNLRRHWQRWEDHYHLDHRRAVEGPGEKRPPGWKHRQAPAAGDWVHPAGGLRCGGAFQLPAHQHAFQPPTLPW